jgi:hypothetical protein
MTNRQSAGTLSHFSKLSFRLVYSLNRVSAFIFLMHSFPRFGDCALKRYAMFSTETVDSFT